MDRPLRIAICGTYGIPARYGGFETCVEETATRLARRGHRVEVFCPRPLGGTAPAQHRGVHLRYNPSVRTKHLATLTQTALAVAKCVRERPNVAHVYIVGNAPLLALLRAARVPCVVSVDGMEWRRAKWGTGAKAYMRLCERLAASLAGELIVDSQVVSDYYASRYGRPGEYAPYGTFTDAPRGPSPLDRFGLRPRGYVLFVGRLTPEKNVHQLVAAFEAVETDLQLAVVGDDPFSRDYVAALKRNRDPRVCFLGYVYGDEALHLFASAYLYVTASGLEGTSPALLTAMGQGCCALVNGIAENRETLGEAGRAYSENDLSDLKRQLQFLLDRPDVVARYGRLARLRAQQVYDWDLVTDTLERVYRRVAR